MQSGDAAVVHAEGKREAVDPPADGDGIPICDKVHEDISKALTEWTIPFPNHGIPNMAHSTSVSKPVIAQGRGNVLRVGMTVCLWMDHEQPVCVAHISKLFQDRRYGAAWMRVRWHYYSGTLEYPQGTFRMCNGAEDERQNICLSGFSSIPAAQLIHWCDSSSTRPILTTTHHLTRLMWNLIANDVRCQDKQDIVDLFTK